MRDRYDETKDIPCGDRGRQAEASKVVSRGVAVEIRCQKREKEKS